MTIARLPVPRSSILGGALLYAMGEAVGRSYSRDALVHAVLHLEQMLTAGGGEHLLATPHPGPVGHGRVLTWRLYSPLGWQDQVGGLFGGVKACSSPAALPLQVFPSPPFPHSCCYRRATRQQRGLCSLFGPPAAQVKTEVLDISPEQCEQLSKHLVLCYTGKARLARNLLQVPQPQTAAHVGATATDLTAMVNDLQGVLRRWFGRLPEVVETVSGLVSNAEAIQGAIASGDIEAFGACVSTYWSQKKKMVRQPRNAKQISAPGSALSALACGRNRLAVGWSRRSSPAC